MSPDPAVVQALRAAGCVFAEEEAGLLMEAARSDEDFASMVQQRISGIPLEHILGWAEFCGRRMVVETGVFVPRRRTEFLVRQAALVAEPGAVVVDLCCGSGAIGAALGDLLGSCQLYGADIDPLAAACAARNIGPRGGQVFQGDLFEPLAPELRGRVDVLMVNAPYVPTGSIAMMPPEARLHEPMAALDGGGDGLDVQRRVVRDSPEWLSPGGALLIETSDVQASATAALMVGVGLRASVLFDGDLGATVVLGRWP